MSNSAQETNQDQTKSQPSQRQHPINQPQMPYLQGTGLIEFGRMDSTYLRLDLVLEVAEQTNLIGAVWDQLYQLTPAEPPINREDWIRVCRTLILKRVQDTYEVARGLRAPNFIHVSRTTLVPAPLGDLLYAIGSFHSRSNGAIIDMIPPERDADNPAPWWQVENDMYFNYCLFCARMQNKYIFYEFPKPHDYEGRTICLTTIHDENGLRTVRAKTNEPTPSDALIRHVNDDLFRANNWLLYDSCFLLASEQKDVLSVRANYIRSYVTGSDA